MQTIAVFSAPAGGIVQINGRLAGETGPDAPLILPVTPNGTLYVEFSPFSRRFRPSAHKFRFIAGRFDETGADDMCYTMLWPDGICEFALTPPAAYPAESEFTTMEGRPIALLRGEAALLRVGQSSIALPEGAQLPRERMIINGAEIYLGKCPEGMYAAAFTAAGLAPVGAVTATEISAGENGLLRARTDLNDTARHARMDTYRPTAASLEPLQTEYMWSEGGPKWPDSAENAAIAAVEAAMLGLDGEAEGYLAPAMRGKDLLRRIASEYDAVIPMRYAAPKSLPAVALTKKTSARTAKVTPLYYRAVPEGGPQGVWLIDRMEIPESAE